MAHISIYSFSGYWPSDILISSQGLDMFLFKLHFCCHRLYEKRADSYIVPLILDKYSHFSLMSMNVKGK